jgi:ABC-type dipeptide/oligopeptide/nickel transport system permease component
MVTTRLYVEGGGDSKALRTTCREGFRRLIEKAGMKGRMPRIVACGGRQNALESFATAHAQATGNDGPMLLVDAEGPLTAANPWAHLAQFVLPAVILGIASAAALMRMTRTMLLEVLRQDYIRTAWSKGLREGAVVLKHGLKNALIPVVTILGIQMAQIFGGTVIFEQIFGLPGMGRFLFDAITQRDYPVIQGINLLIVSIVVAMNLVVDVLYAILDPRIRY